MKSLGTLAIALGCLVGCGGPDFDANRSKWRDQRPEEYVIETCGLGFDPGCSVHAVSGNTVVASAFNLNIGNGWSFAEAPVQEDPVEALFDRAERQSDDCEFSISFDDHYGYVTRYYQECDNESGGEKVVCFLPDTTDVSRCTG